jgi:hypothetical protein
MVRLQPGGELLVLRRDLARRRDRGRGQPCCALDPDRAWIPPSGCTALSPSSPTVRPLFGSSKRHLRPPRRGATAPSSLSAASAIRCICSPAGCGFPCDTGLVLAIRSGSRGLCRCSEPASGLAGTRPPVVASGIARAAIHQISAIEWQLYAAIWLFRPRADRQALICRLAAGSGWAGVLRARFRPAARVRRLAGG